MKREQIAKYLNDTLREVIGESAVVNEDLSNIVTIGNEIPSDQLDNIFGKIIDKVGYVIFVTRKYKGTAPNILKFDWEFGSILEKIRVDVPDAVENESWGLIKGDIVECFQFTPPSVRAKYFNKAITFEIPISYTNIQLRDCFSSAERMTTFFNCVENAIETGMTAYTDLLQMRTITNMIALKIHNNNNVVNLLSEYKTATGDTTITSATALSNENFLRHCSKVIKLYEDRIKTLSMLYNDDGYATFTPSEDRKLVLLSEFARSMETSLYSNTYNKDDVKIDNFDTVSFWQGSGTVPTFAENSKIDLTATNIDGEKVTVSKSGIVGALFDINGCVVCRRNYRVVSTPVARGEFVNYWYKWDAEYINDTAENFIVFTIEDE